MIITRKAKESAVMEKTQPPVVKRSLFSWVLAGNGKLQLLLIAIIVVTVFARVLPLEMQKRVVNEAIKLRDIDLLLYYCGIYLVSVITASGLKYLITLIQTLIGQRVLARMRKDLYHHILTLPLNFFRRTQPGMVVSALITELTTSGTFAGMAVAVPITNVLTLIAFAAYLLWLNWTLALISLAIYPIVLFLVPLLQKRANQANKQRVDNTRILSSKIAESMTGIHEIQSNGAYRIENRKYDRVVDRLLKIRITWTLFTQGVKVTNNFFTALGPFFIFIVGGYLAMKGRLELGALVAFLSAQEKLYDPWKELIEFYQVYQDASVRYRRTMEYFDVAPEHLLEPTDRDPYKLDGRLEVKDLSFATEDGIQLLDGISFTLNPGDQMALVGFSGSGKSTLAQCIGQLYKYSGGSIQFDSREVSELTKKDMVHNTGFVSQSPFIFDGTIQDNLLYSCTAAGNGDSDPGGLPSLDDMIAVLHQTGIFVDVLRFGLNANLDKDRYHDLISQLIRVRENFQQNFGDVLSDVVEFFDQDRYLYYSSIADNLTFGAPNREEWATQNLCNNPYFMNFLTHADLTRPLLSLGAELSRQTVDVLGNLPPEAVFFEQSPIGPEELDTYKALVTDLKKKKLHQLSASERLKLLDLALRFTPGIHKLVGIPQMLENLVLEGRSLLREKVLADDPEALTFYEISDYIYSQTILNNILFGKTNSNQTRAQETIDQSIIQLLIEEDLLETIVEIGMQFQVGTKGDRLSGGQRQKLAIARSFLKQPRLLIMDEATSALDNKSQTRIQNLLENRWRGKATVIAVVHRLDIIKNYDQIAVMKAGKIVEMGSYDALIGRKGMLYELEFGNK